MRVDLHTHTFPSSSCSTTSREEYLLKCRVEKIEAIALTNHGDMGDNMALEKPFADAGILLVHGIEISTLFGDFIIFSSDLDYLATLKDVQPLPRPHERPARTAVVWVHPAAGGGRSGSSYYTGLAAQVAPQIDAVEVFNGNWMGSRFVEAARGIAQEYGTAQTGGSDAHTAAHIGRCSTDFSVPIQSTDDVVDALRARATAPFAETRPSRLGRLFGR
jgi:predicted metal-dependent phosphoesterase TrpH